tara:strand:- start:411 stop:707 length:297 start_codon:yes stop_codon:yes gene_type:complete
MSNHAVGDALESQAVPPGGSQDPEPYSSAYFVFWGFTLLLAMVVALQYLAWDWEASTRDAGAGNTNAGAAAELRAEQEARMPRIGTSMNSIVKKHGGR